MAFEYKGTLIKDPITGKLRYDNPQALPTSTGAGHLLPQQEQKIIRDNRGLPARQTTSPYPIHQQPALKMHPMTTPEAAGFPALDNSGVSQGAVPTGIAGYFGLAKDGETQTTKFTPNQSGVATGGFALPKNATANLAAEEAEYTKSRDITDRRTRLDQAEANLKLQDRLYSAIASNNRPEAMLLTEALKAASGTQPHDMSKQGEVDIKRSMMPAQNKLAESQANLFGQQAAAIPYNTAIQKYIAEHAAKNQPKDYNSQIAALVKSGVDMDEAMALAGIPDNATPEQRQQVIAKIRERKKG